MSTPSSGHSGDEPCKDRGVAITLTRPRPDYAQLHADFYHLAAKRFHKKTLNWKQARVWVQARQNFEKALFRLRPKSGLGKVILDPADTHAENVRVTNAIICLHDWLRLYQEIIKQPPPEGLLEIEMILRARRDELNHLYPPKARQWD